MNLVRWPLKAHSSYSIVQFYCAIELKVPEMILVLEVTKCIFSLTSLAHTNDNSLF